MAMNNNIIVTDILKTNAKICIESKVKFSFTINVEFYSYIYIN